jgi:hypothetical protein
LRRHFPATPFQIPNGCRLQIASPHSVPKSPRKGRDPRIGEAWKSSKSTVARIVFLRNKTHKNRHRPFSRISRPGRGVPRGDHPPPLGLAFRAGRSPTLSNERLANE